MSLLAMNLNAPSKDIYCIDGFYCTTHSIADNIVKED